MSQLFENKSGKRLNNKEFREFIPNLQHYEQFFIEILKEDKWFRMFDVVFKIKHPNTIGCNLCLETIYTYDFIRHISMNRHNSLLDDVTQFYHPAYTYAKRSDKLAKGEPHSDVEIKKAIADAENELSKTDRNELTQVQRFAALISKQTGHSEITLPLMEMLALEFSIKKDIWQPLLTTDNPHPSNVFLCRLCSIKCGGIITVNAHFAGSNHRRLQLETRGVRCKLREQLNKYCIIRYDKEYSFLHFDSKKGQHFIKSDEKNVKDNGNNAEYTNVKQTNSKPNQSNEIGDKFQTFDKSFDKNIDHEVKRPKINAIVEEEGLIGVEYVVKVVNKETNDVSFYECCLCEVVRDSPIRMQEHVITMHHRLKYCELHYCDTITKYKNTIGHTNYSNYTRLMEYVLVRLSSAIEKHHGRAMPFEVDEDTFNRKRSDIVADVYSLPHACQQYGPSFSNTVKSTELHELKLQKIVLKKSGNSYNNSSRFLKNPDKIYLALKSVDRGSKGTRRDVSNLNSGYLEKEVDRLPRKRVRSSSQQDVEIKRKSPGNIWKVFRNEVSTAATNIEQSYIKYRQNPECHPLYDKEWNKFWKSRKDELVKQGVDYRSYNFQPEWVKHFKQRIEELFGEALHSSQIQIRQRLNIPLDVEEDSPESTKKFETFDHNSPIKKSRENKPISQAPNFMNIEKVKQPERKKEIDVINSDQPNIIHVLRLLTALEDHLGSLGGKIINLLSQVLVLEKSIKNQNELTRTILTSENCILLETANEKLKGILYAGLLDDIKTNGFNRVIRYTSDLLRYAEKMGWRRATNVRYPDKVDDSQGIRNLIEILQNESSTEILKNKKSLSDTLMELISTQKPAEPINISKTNSEKLNTFSQNNLESERYMCSTRNYGNPVSNPKNLSQNEDKKPSLIKQHMQNTVGASILNFNTSLSTSAVTSHLAGANKSYQYENNGNNYFNNQGYFPNNFPTPGVADGSKNVYNYRSQYDNNTQINNAVHRNY